MDLEEHLAVAREHQAVVKALLAVVWALMAVPSRQHSRDTEVHTAELQRDKHHLLTRSLLQAMSVVVDSPEIH